MKAFKAWTRQLAVVLLCFFGISLAEAGPQPGRVVAWGSNDAGQTNAPPGLTSVVAVAAGGLHSLALQSSGTVVAWGYNANGQTNVPSGLSNAVAIAAGYSHSLALRGNGTVADWGYNSYGQTNVAPGLSNVVAIAAGNAHNLALQGNGTVVAWGLNANGQTNVPPGLANVAAIAAGEYHSLALLSNGTVVAWGYNGYGQTNVPLGLSNVSAIAAGNAHNLALQANGTVVVWGNNANGQTNVPPGLSNVAVIAAGEYHSLALLSNGTVVAWGLNVSGQTNVPLGLNNVVAIAAGASHSLAVTLTPAIPLGLPAAISLAPGMITNLSVAVSSGSPFNCQWSLNGLPLEGETGTSLVITNFDLPQAGAYSVVVTNPYGYATAATLLRLNNSPIILVSAADVGGGTVSRTNLTQITLSSSFGASAKIYYTLDGSEPDFTATPYSIAFTLTNSKAIRAIAYNSAYTDWAQAAPIYVQIWPTYPLVASTLGGGGVSVSPTAYSGGNRYVSNTIATLTATSSNGWSFMSWSGDSTATTNVTTLTLDQPRAAQAIFGTSLNLFTNGSGQLLLNPPTGPYPFGSTVQIAALPSAGHYFYGWVNAASGFANPLWFTVTNASGITALFGLLETNQVSLTVPASSGGLVTVNPSRNVYTNGDVVTLTATPATNYVFTGWSGDALGSLNPLPLPLNTSKLVTATFALAANLFSSLQVMLSPTGAVSAGAQWQVDGGPWQSSATILSNLTLGAHTVSFLPLTNWLTPSNQVVMAIYGQTTNRTATYIALGSLQVIINPIGAVSAGAQWRVDGSAWQATGSVVSNLVAGAHTVSFTNLTGWTTPTNQTVTVNPNQNTVVTGIYAQQFGNLQVGLSPAGAVSAGAQWQIDAGGWLPSGTTLTNLTAGNHAIAYATIAGWTAPTNQTVTISPNQTTRITALYLGQGSLQVLLLPAGAIAAGAQWQVDGGAWLSNRAMVYGLTRGTHTVSYQPVSGWVAPASQSVSILADQTTVTTGVYSGLGYEFATIAGTAGNPAFADGTNHAARFNTPVGMAADAQNNLFIADTGNSVIRQLTPTKDGWVSRTIAGLAGYPGNADGTNSQARFDYPAGVAVDASGDIYVADQGNSTVRRISPTGTNWVVSTIAGLAGNYGSANGTNGSARFYNPAGVAVDLAGNVYVADQINSTIRKVTPISSNNWVVTTIAGTAGTTGSTDGTNSAARFYWPSDLGVDSSGNIFVADTLNHTIRKITPVGANFMVTTVCGVAGMNGSADGTNTATLLDGPGALSLDASDNLYVADSYSSVIRKITPVGTNWVVNTVGGLAYATGTADGMNSAARFDGPYGVCASASGALFVADTYNHTIRAATPLSPSPSGPYLTPLSQTASPFAFAWSAQPGLWYQVQYKVPLRQGNWINLAAPTLATNSQMSFADTASTNAAGFYRVLVLP